MKRIALSVATLLVAMLSPFIPSTWAQQQQPCCLTFTPNNSTLYSWVTVYPNFVPGNPDPLHGFTTPPAWFAVDVESGQPIPSGVYPGWCVDESHFLPATQSHIPGTPYVGTLISTCDPAELSEIPYHDGTIPVGPPPTVSWDTWHLVNYILNHKSKYYWWNVQTAINRLVGGPGVNDPGYVFTPPVGYPPVDILEVTQIISDALHNGPSWTATCGDVVGVIFAIPDYLSGGVSTSYQLIILEVPCVCLTCPTSCGNVNIPYSSSLVAGAKTQPFTFSINSGSLPPGLTLNPVTGAITGVPTTAGNFPFTAKVVDSSTPTQTKTVDCSITIYPPLSISCPTTPAQLGVAYSSSWTASGGSGSFTYSIVGNLPPGLHANVNTGAITGTPTTAGTYNFTIYATDNSGCGSAQQPCSITVGGNPSANCVTINAVQGVPITPVTMIGSGGCGGPYTFVATGLPNNLIMSTSGTISGTPTVTGVFNYSVQVTDNCGNKGTVNCSVTVNPPPSANCVTINAPVQGVPITPVTMVGSGGCGGPYTFTATGLPNGLTMSTSGTISGTPLASGTFNYTVTVTDNCGNKGTVNCSVMVNCTGQIGDFVWNDLNGNGCQDANEPGIAGVTVALYIGCGVSGNPIMTTTTDNTGHYLFQGLCAGTYTVSFTTPAGYARTTANAGCKDASQPLYSQDRDSKCNCQTGTPCGVCVTLTPSANVNLNVDCGYVCNGQIGDFVWNDLNGNGCQDANEPGIAGVAVALYAGCGVSGTPIMTTTTDNTGHYLFQGLCAGTYTVNFTTPTGYARTTANAGCKDLNQPPYTQDRDSKCDCPTGTPCGVCVTLTPAAAVNLNVDCGYVCLANGQIGDFVWNDVNGNGCQDANEPGIGGVRVDLYAGCGVTGTPIQSVVTDNTGHYLFQSLCAGTYTVSFVTPDGYTRTVAKAGCKDSNQPSYTQDRDSKCDCPTGTPCGVCVTLTPAAPINLNIDCGYVCVPNGQIGDYVWNDLNGNGCQDANEPGLGGVRVDLYAGCGVTGTPIQSVTTDNTGHYLFQSLCPGTYTVSFVTPSGYTRTTAKAGCKDFSQPPYTQDRDSKCDCPTGTPCGVCVTLTTANPINLNIDCGYLCVANGQIGDYVWNDLNGNGCQDANEPGIGGVRVDLYLGCGVIGTPIQSVVTDNTGHYLFQNLCAGTYTVSFVTPTGYTRTVAKAGCKDLNQPPYTQDRDSKCDCPTGTPCGVCVTLTPANPINLNIDCGYVCLATGQIGDYVWNDLNGNGCQDANEPGLGGVRVDLYNGCGVVGTPVQSVVTDNTGHYLFQNLCAGTYTVSFVTPDGYLRTVAKAGCKDLTQPGYTQDRDSKCDCPTGIPCGVCVTLTPANPINLNIDCGYVCVPTGQIGDYVWNDLNGNGCQDANEPGLGGVRVDLYAGCGVTGTPIQSVTTDNTGHYLFQSLCPGTYTVSFVTPSGYTRTTAKAGCKDLTQPSYTQDRDSKCDCPTGTPCGVCVTLTPAAPLNLNIDCGYVCAATGQIGDYVWNDLNGNGCQDINEPGIGGVRVDLYLGCGVTGTPIQSVLTDNTGHYLFQNLCVGTYTVSFVTPTGFTRTVAKAGCKDLTQPGYTQDRDSKCDCPTGVPCGVCVTLTPSNPINLNVDCGYLCLPIGQIGDYVWNDVNGNGCQDPNEPGIANVQVDLYMGTCGGTRIWIATTFTDVTGHYLFRDLCLGDYQVAITTPVGYTATIPHAGCALAGLPPYANQTDSKCDCTGASPCFTCVSLTAVNPINLNIDCGYICNGQIGNYVWYDLNGNGCQDSNEPGVANVQVDLYKGPCGGARTHLATTFTDGTGHYLFSGLCPGDYQVAITTPAGLTATIPHQGCTPNPNLPPYANETDSKCDCNGASPCFICVSLTPANMVNLNVDCGYVVPPPRIELKKSVDKSFVLPGGQVTYTYVVKNTGGITVRNITVVDDNGTPTDPTDDVTVGTVASLDPGQSKTFTFTETLPQQLCLTINGQEVLVGSLYTTVLPSGDIQVKYVQHNVNDNRYGTGATAATGWPSGHKFSDLTGSDHAEFIFKDANGNTVLDFYEDYISQANSATFPSGTVNYPSGYGTLGVTGGDGKMITGSSSYVLSGTTSLTDDLLAYPTGYLVNSPPETAPLSGVSTVAPKWNYDDSYTVTVSKAAFGAAGFGSVSIGALHNSPAKMGSNIPPTPCQPCLVNVAVATGTAGGVTLTASATAQVCFGTPPPPGMSMTKTADQTVISPTGDSVTYTYTVKNTGSQVINNITVTDDNGTPNDTSDDFTVGTIPTLAIGASASLTATRQLTPPSDLDALCETINGVSVVVGLVKTTTLPSGDIQITYIQQNVNDNRYGTGATAATGWAAGHKFNDLVGSDKAEFKILDGNGNLVLDFYLDYISQAGSATFPSGTVTYPSGYGTLGVTGGDGKMVSGNPNYVLFADTSFTEDLNNPTFQTGYLVNSPPETAPLSGVSIPAGWDYNNSYTVVISKAAFGGNGFGGVAIGEVHNSPAKSGSNQIFPTPCQACVVNVATAAGTAADNTPQQVTASAQVCFGVPAPGQTCNLTAGTVKISSNTIQITIKNNGTAPIYLSEITANWPAVNGTLKKVSLNGDVWAGSDTAPDTLATGDFDAFNTDTNRRKIDKGQTKTLVLQFEKNASPNTALYSITAKFGSDGSCAVSYP